jgi:hypothetical protein
VQPEAETRISRVETNADNPDHHLCALVGFLFEAELESGLLLFGVDLQILKKRVEEDSVKPLRHTNAPCTSTTKRPAIVCGHLRHSDKLEF